MDNDDRTIGTILNRREALARLGSVGFGLVAGRYAAGSELLGAKPSPIIQTQTKEIIRQPMVVSPALTQGPFFVDEMLNRSDLIGNTQRPSVINGLRLEMRLRCWELDGNIGKPLKGAQVDLWHCDAIGVYSDEPNGGGGENTLGQTWLRGYQLSDKGGLVVFKTIWPGWYPGRTIHFHFKVRFPMGGNTYDFTSQFFINDTLNDQVMANPPYNGRGNRNTRNSNDGIYRTRLNDNSFAGDRLLLDISDNPLGGKIAQFDIAFDIPGQ